MRTSRIIAGATIALTLAAIAPALPAHAAPPTAPYNVFSLAGNWNAVAHDNMTLQPFEFEDREGFHVSGYVDGGSYSARVESLTGQILTTGTFATKRFSDATHAALDVSGNGSGCGDTTGSVTIHEIGRDPETNDITSVALTYRQDTCYAVAGEVRWNSSMGYTAALNTTRRLDFGPQNAGEPSPFQTVTFRSLGSTSVTFGEAAFGGVNPASFVLGNDTCSGVTLVYDQTCSIQVAARPDGLAERQATLQIPSNTAGGKESVSLYSFGVKGNRGTYLPVAPSRILDTRTGNGAPATSVGAGQSIELQVTGRGGIPATGVSAVALNITVTSPTAHGHVTVWPTGKTRPNASSLNFTPGWTGANSVTVALGTNGKISLYNSAGNTHLIADVVGWYADPSISWNPGGGLITYEPERVLDTRDAADWPWGPLEPDSWAYITLHFGSPEANWRVKAFVVNITATGTTTPGYLAAWNGDEWNMPQSSTLNLIPGQNVSNWAVVPTRPCSTCEGQFANAPQIAVYSNGWTHVVIDVFAVFDNGYYADALRFEAINPTRIVDSRVPQGVPGALGQGGTHTVTAPDTVRNSSTEALALNVTGIQPSGYTFMTVWPNGITKPFVSNLNLSPGQIMPNAVITGIDSAYKFNVFNNALTTHYAVDVVGHYYLYPYAGQTGLGGQARSGGQTTASSLAIGGVDTARGGR